MRITLRNLIRVVAGGIACLLLATCSSTPQILDPEIFYKRDIRIEVNEKEYEGVTTVPNAPDYKLKLKPRGDMDLIIIRTCAREDSAEEQSSGFFIFKGDEFEYHYIPNPGLEDVGVCPLRVDVYDSGEGKHSWALLDFEHPDYEVPFEVDCNGRRRLFSGVGVCQARNGLIQRFHFKEPIRFATPLPSGCPMPEKKSNYVYDFKIALEECLYHFDTKGGRLGRLTTIGYEGILVRENQ